MKHFLNAAEIVLRRFNKPLKITDIVDRAIEEGILKSNGLTPENTMRARLSEHIRKLGKDSIFIRVDKNKFALREWKIIGQEFDNPFVKKDKDESVVCLKQSSIDKIGRIFGFTDKFQEYLKLCKDQSNIVICKRKKANHDYSIKQIVSYVIVKNEINEVLTYARGNYTNIKDRLLKGVLCIGFGGHVNKDDYQNLFGLIDGGTTNAAIRELSEELKRVKIDNPKMIGIINDDSSPLGLNHIAFVFETQISSKINAKDISAELSINKLKFLDFNELTQRYSELEFWSQLLVKYLLNRKIPPGEVIIKEKKKKISTPIIIVGEIGSGKTEIAKLVARRLNFEYISTRKIVSDLINLEDFGTQNRFTFQTRSLDLIQTQNGAEQIAKTLNSIYLRNNNLVIDGIRNLETFEQIKAFIPTACLVYIDAPIDSSYEFFNRRSKREVSIHEFREVRFHDVEKEIVLFKNRSDIYIYNGSTFNNLIKRLTEWLNEKA